MSEIAENCAASVILADYVAIDSAGKANVVGGGISFVGFDPQMNLTSPFALYVVVATPMPSNHENQAAMEITLVRSDGQIVLLPGNDGVPAPLRISQIIEFKLNQPQGTDRPPANFPSTVSTAVHFANGLPLTPGVHYRWEIKVDGELKATTSFMVPQPSAPPVFG